MKVDSRRSVGVRRGYPWRLSLGMIAFALVLSFVDLMFLNEVIGRVLDLGAIESMFVAFGLGLVGISIMASVGAMKAHGHDSIFAKVGLYGLWLLLGVSFMVLRLLSATILELDPALGDAGVSEFAGLTYRQSDLVLGPIMLLLYIATGVMALEGTKHLLSSPDFSRALSRWKAGKDRLNKENAMRAAKAEEELQKARDEAAARAKEAEEARRKALKEGELERYYQKLLSQYRRLEDELMDQYRLISQNIEYIKRRDKEELAFETKTKPGFMNIYSDSLRSSQGEVVLLMNKRNGGGIAEYREVVNGHNAGRDGLSK